MPVTYQKERFGSIMDQLPELFHAHYEEFEEDKANLPLDVDWGKFSQLDTIGKVHIMTARDNGQLIGYIFWHVQTTAHHAKTILAATDLIYVAPCENRGIILRRLIKESQKMVRDLGGKKLYIVVKAGSPAAKLLRTMGFSLTEETFSCLL